MSTNSMGMQEGTLTKFIIFSWPATLFVRLTGSIEIDEIGLQCVDGVAGVTGSFPLVQKILLYNT